MKKKMKLKNLKKILSMMVICSLSVSCLSNVKNVASKQHDEKENYIILTENSRNKPLEKFMDEYQCTNISNNNDIFVAETNETDISELKTLENVISIEKDIDVHASQSDSGILYKKNVNKEWNKKLIDFSKSNKPNNKNKIKISILDSGIDYGNDIDLKESISLVPGEENINPLFMDGTGHGNSVAGLIAAKGNDERITGINPNAEIYSVRVLDDNNVAPLSRVIEGIYYSIEKKVNIINMSFGTPTYSEALRRAIDDANQAGILVIAAAGNTGGKVEYPAAFSNVFSVGSVDSNAKLSDTSAKGNEVEIVAPGENICSIGQFGDILISSGTSLSAPQVSAAASILWQKDINVSNKFIKELLVKSANHSMSGNYGILDIDYALKIYNKAKKSYKDDKSIILEKNTTPIETFEDTGCVNGSWTIAKHEELIGSNHSYVKQGARYADVSSNTKGITDNPWWHGSFHENYISAYIYATKMAEKLGEGKAASAASTVAGLSATAKKNMLNDIELFVKNTDYTKGQKRAFVWGMAMHTAADVFSHSATAYISSSGKWGHLAHGKNGDNNYADNPSKYSGRYAAAKAVVKKIVELYDKNDKSIGSYKQFSGVNNTTKNYRIIDFVKNIKATTSASISTPYSSYDVSNRAIILFHWKG